MFSIKGLRDWGGDIHKLFGRKAALDEKLKNMLMESRDAGDAIQQTTQTRGYNILADALRGRFDALVAELRRSRPENVAKLQAQLEELEFVLDFARKKIEIGEAARESLERLLKEQEEQDARDDGTTS